jgi:hypothetical protein
MPPRAVPPPPTKFGASSLQQRPAIAAPTVQLRGAPAGARLVAPPPVRPPQRLVPPVPQPTISRQPPVLHSRATIQRAAVAVARRNSVDLGSLGEHLLRIAKAGDSSTQEVQILDAGAGLHVASNSDGHTSGALASATLFNSYIDGANKAVKKHQDPYVKAKKISAVKAPDGLVPVNGKLHAEQNLLRDYSRKLKNAESAGTLDTLDKTVRVFGAKPPCNICKMVMVAFEAALAGVYGITLRYNTNTGDTSVLEKNSGKLSADDMSVAAGGGTMPEKFQQFLAAYTQNLT